MQRLTSLRKKYIYLLQTAKLCNVKKNYFNIYLDKCIVKKRREDVIKCSRNALTYLETYLDKMIEHTIWNAILKCFAQDLPLFSACHCTRPNAYIPYQYMLLVDLSKKVL